MRIVTSGSEYIDIDAYAGAIAYAELLQAQGIEARAVSTAPLNESISGTVRSWRAPLQTDYEPAGSDTFSVIDVSDSAYFDGIVDYDRVVEVIDHHPGFEKHWQDRLGDGAQIEFIGAACTLIYERWKAAGLLGKMSALSARLLACGILDNTLNFGASVTTPRDVEAYDTLLPQAELPDDWTAQYFTECQQAILREPAEAVRNDAKRLSFQTYARPARVGQLTVWDAEEVASENRGVIREVLSDDTPEWFMNLISVREGRSYLLSDNLEVQKWLEGLLGVKFDGDIAVADRLWLRKEIIKQDIDSGGER
jgi:inorganic pyrophosphatase/exopolyphosphatase